jgi:hypothetical protein
VGDFNRIFGRNYDPSSKKYKMQDAEVAFFIRAPTPPKAAINQMCRLMPGWSAALGPVLAHPADAEAFSRHAGFGGCTSYGGAMRREPGP